MKYTTIEEQLKAQVIRARNALLAAPDYHCEMIPGAQANMIRVVKPDGASEYVMPTACSCRDHCINLVGTQVRCKHRLLVDAFLASGHVLPLPNPPVDTERARRMVESNRNRDFPEGN